MGNSRSRGRKSAKKEHQLKKSEEHEKWGTKNNTPLFNYISRLKHRNLIFRPYYTILKNQE